MRVVLQSGWEAALLSAMVPGAGHVASGRGMRGVAWIAGLAAGVALFLWVLITPLVPSPVPGFAAAGLLGAAWLAMVWDAGRAVPRTGPRGSGGPAVAALVSFVVPGVGQLLQRRWGVGLVILGARLLLVLAQVQLRKRFGIDVVWIEGAYGLLSAVLKLVAVVDAYEAGIRRTGSPGIPRRLVVLVFLLHAAWVPALTYAGFLALDVFSIRSSAMEPALRGARIQRDTAVRVLAGDRVIVDRFTYRIRAPRRGEIVLFRMAGTMDTAGGAHALRVAGVPGETISVAPPYLQVNGTPLKDPAIFEEIARRTEEGGYRLAGTNAPRARLKSVSDTVCLGPGEYFLVGDNTRHNLDSRYWGPVMDYRIVGRVTKVLERAEWTADSSAVVRGP